MSDKAWMGLSIFAGVRGGGVYACVTKQRVAATLAERTRCVPPRILTLTATAARRLRACRARNRSTSATSYSPAVSAAAKASSLDASRRYSRAERRAMSINSSPFSPAVATSPDPAAWSCSASAWTRPFANDRHRLACVRSEHGKG